MLKITRVIYSFVLATVAMTNANVVEKGSSGKPGLLRNPPRVLNVADPAVKGQTPGSKAQKASKGARLPVCHFSDDIDTECPWKTITVSENAIESHVLEHGDYNGTCIDKCIDDGGVYNANTCMCDIDDEGSMSTRMLQALDEVDVEGEWGYQV